MFSVCCFLNFHIISDPSRKLAACSLCEVQMFLPEMPTFQILMQSFEDNATDSIINTRIGNKA